MIVGTAGHIDHGKTLLVKALTGVETDRLKEEKARGITIELGFAYLPLPGGGVLGFVDVPGHERFVHTMLAGAASIDFVMLVVAADDGVMRQTREHLQIIDLLGIRDGLVVLNKCDLADDARLADVEADIRGVTAGSSLEGADIVRVSARTGTGIAALQERLIEEAESRPERGSSGAFRMCVDRSFTVQGTGTVVTGGVLSGAVAVGDRIVTLPRRAEVRVRSVHAQGRATDRGLQGDRCALNLAGIERTDIGRGDWLTVPDRTATTTRFDVDLRLLASEPRPLRSGLPVHLHLGTTAAGARIALLDADRVAPGSRARAQLMLDVALPVRAGDRFVLRDAAAERTIGGGRVIDPRAPQRYRRTPERHAMLSALAHEDPADALAALLALPPGLVDFTAFVVDRNLSVAEAEQLLGSLDVQRAEVEGTTFLAQPAAVATLETAAAKALAAHHAGHPELAGHTPESLRLTLQPRLGKLPFRALVAMLTARGAIVADPTAVRLKGHTSSLGAADAKLWEKVLALLAATPTRPPQVREMAEHLGQPITTVRKLCKSMARIGTLVEVAADRFFLRTTLAELGEIAKRLAEANPERTFTAAEFRDKAGSGRNIGIQVLEYFDRQRLTLRKGDVRLVVREPREVLARTPDQR